MAAYEVWLGDDLGRPLLMLDEALMSLEYVKVMPGAGYFRLDYGELLPAELLGVDHQLRVFRRPVGAESLGLDFLGFMRFWRWEIDGDRESTTLAGPDQNEELVRRIVAYAAGTSQATIAGAADDGLKDVFNENFLGGATDSDRDISGLGVSVAADDTAGASVDKGFSWRDVARVMQDVAAAADTAGGEVFYWIEVAGIDPATDEAQLVFRTAVDVPGRDRTWQTANPAIFGPKFGNVGRVFLEEDYRGEINFVYAGGQGEGSERLMKTAADDTRIGASVWNRREGFKDARNEADPDAVQAAADAELAAGRPVTRFEAEILDTDQARYGVHWDLGDLVTLQAFGRQFDGLMRMVRVKVAGGREAVQARAVLEAAL